MNNLGKFYNEKAQFYKPSKGRTTKILELMGDNPGRQIRVLDIGCGSGLLGISIKQKFNAHVTGWDVSSDAIVLAKKALDEAVVFDIEKDDLSAIKERFDFIIATEVIEHLFDPESFLKNIQKIMSPETKLILTTPNFLVWTNRLKMLMGKFEYTESGFLDYGHIHFFSRFSLMKSLVRADLKVLKENNVYHHRIPEWLGILFSNLFAFQTVLIVQKKTSIN